jgi:hypothetical protein
VYISTSFLLGILKCYYDFDLGLTNVLVILCYSIAMDQKITKFLQKLLLKEDKARYKRQDLQSKQDQEIYKPIDPTKTYNLTDEVNELLGRLNTMNFSLNSKYLKNNKCKYKWPMNIDRSAGIENFTSNNNLELMECLSSHM